MNSSQKSVKLHTAGSSSGRGETTYEEWSLWLKQDRNQERMSDWLHRRTPITRISTQLDFPISASSLTNYLMRDERFRKIVERNSKLSRKGKQRFNGLGLIDQDDFERRVVGDQESDLPPASCMTLMEHYGVSRRTVIHRWTRCTAEFKRRHRSTFYSAGSTTKQAPPQPGIDRDQLQRHLPQTTTGTNKTLQLIEVLQTSSESARPPTLYQNDFMSKLVGEQGTPMDAQYLRDHYNVPMSQIYGTWWRCPLEWRKEHLSIFTGSGPAIHTIRGTQAESAPNRSQGEALNSAVDMLGADTGAYNTGGDFNPRVQCSMLR